MKLYDKGRFNLTDKIADYLPFLQRTNKKDITIQELLYHQSGLPPGIAFYREAIDEDSYEGRLFMSRKDARHPLQLGTSTWANPNFAFKKEYVSKVKTGDYTLQICDSLWLNPSFFKEMEKKIVDAPMKPKTYRYSDVGFILLRLLVEKLAGMPMDAYLQREFYEPMGLERTGYRLCAVSRSRKSFPLLSIVSCGRLRFRDLCTMRRLPFRVESREMPDYSRMHVKWHKSTRCY